MTADVVARIFEPLFTTKRNGTGLGLPVAQQLVMRNEGMIFVDSVPGQGTTFHLLLKKPSSMAMRGTQRVAR
jgi:signal transduction histidine kinase